MRSREKQAESLVRCRLFDPIVFAPGYVGTKYLPGAQTRRHYLGIYSCTGN